MTKKSMARMERDTKKKAYKQQQEQINSLKWEEAEEMYKNSLDALGTTTLLEVPLKEVYEYVADKDYLNNVLDTLTKDVGQLKEEVDLIHKAHEGRTGNCTEDDIMEFIEIAQGYEMWYGRYAGVVEASHDAVIDIHYQAKVAEAQAKGMPVEEVQRMQSGLFSNHIQVEQ